MKNLWTDEAAEAMVGHYAGHGIGRDLALRVYTTRLLGGEPRLVLHGGGNTSVKTTLPDTLGAGVEVLCVKGSGWDMGNIEPAGLPAVRLAPLRELASLEALSDEAMVNAQRCNLLDSSAPNPSVETLFHAFLPHRYIDHTHACDVLALTDQPDGAAICAEVFGARAALVPYIMPGFALARRAQEIWQANPDCEGLILLKHGIFSFGETAREAYDRMIDLTTLAGDYLARGPGRPLVQVRLPDAVAGVATVVPVLRGLVAIPVDPEAGTWRRFVLDHRAGDAVMNYVNGEDVGRYSQAGVATPDHAIRTKPVPLVLPSPRADDPDGFRAAAVAGFAIFAAGYHDYFGRNNARQEQPRTELDPMPRVVLVPGVGLFGVGASAKAARIAADIAENAIDVITAAESIGRFESISEADLFDIEYWSLEQAKLGRGVESPLSGQVVVVTGGAGAIGAATAAAFAREGAAVAVLDIDGEAAAAVAADLDGPGLACDVTDPDSVRQAFDRVCATFGGVDIVVSNAGAAWQGVIADVDDAELRASFELNFFAHQTVARNAVRVMRAQGTGGVLLFNASKQAINPGPGFGPYGLPKAATLSLMRQYALDHGADGIRANAVNADRIRSGLLDDAMVRERATARQVSEAGYMAGNLLGREVRAADVADAFVSLARAGRTTGAVLTVDGGNIAAALR